MSEYMKKAKIRDLEDKDLQLRYYLGGLKIISNGDYQCTYWTCNINCSCDPVLDDENFKKILEFRDKHNFENERVAKLIYNYLIGAVMKYNESYTPLFEELGKIIKPYNFINKDSGKVEDIGYKEKDIVDKVYVNNGGKVWDFMYKYNITQEDFIALAKMYANDSIHGLCLSNPDDKFMIELEEIINGFNIGISKSELEAYRSAYAESKYNTELVMNTRNAQKKYLIFIKELLEKEPNLAREILSDELRQLGFNKHVSKIVEAKVFYK